MSESTQIKYNSEEANNAKIAKQNNPGSVAFLRHSARKRGGLPSPHGAALLAYKL